MAEREVTLRERVIGTVAESLMVTMDKDEMALTKEGLLMEVDEEQFVVKVIQKKKQVHQEDIRDILTKGELDTLFNEVDEDEGFEAEDEEDEIDPETEHTNELQDAHVAEQVAQ